MKYTSITGLSGARSGPLSFKQAAFKLYKTIGVVPNMTQDKVKGASSNPAKWWPGIMGIIEFKPPVEGLSEFDGKDDNAI